LIVKEAGGTVSDFNKSNNWLLKEKLLQQILFFKTQWKK
jgi:hypothetical protein